LKINLFFADGLFRHERKKFIKNRFIKRKNRIFICGSQRREVFLKLSKRKKKKKNKRKSVDKKRIQWYIHFTKKDKSPKKQLNKKLCL